MSDHPTRRKILTSAASALPAMALAATPVAAGSFAGEDAALLRLWDEYLAHARAYAVAEAAYDPVRAAFDAEMPPFPPDVLPGDHWEAMQPLWHKYGLDALSDASNEAHSKANVTIAAILATPAEGLIGIGIKLTAMQLDRENVSEEDMADAIESAMRDITRLTGIDFAAIGAGCGEDEA